MLLFGKRRGSAKHNEDDNKDWGCGSVVAQMSVSLNCMFSNRYRSSVTEYSPDFN